MISICITVKNRSRAKVGDHELLLLPNCVRSIVDSVVQDIPCELIITDWQSDDWPLSDWLEQTCNGLHFQLVTVEGKFYRGEGRNLAAKRAKGDVLLFIDADSIICPAILQNGLKYINQGKAYFPILFSFNDPEHQNGWWRSEGYGNCMVSREMYDQSGGWPEYHRWGKEDVDFFTRISSSVDVVRERVHGFYHQWHPKDLLWKDKHLFTHDFIVQEKNRRAVLLKQLEEALPQTVNFIFVDENYFGENPVHGCHAIPFLEKDGEYWGPPSDDAEAIKEFQRMKGDGAEFIAFAWTAFWWLDYYKEFNEYLRCNFSCALESEYLIVFDLRH